MIVYFIILCLIVILFLIAKDKQKEGLECDNSVKSLNGCDCSYNLSIDISGNTTCYDVSSNNIYKFINLKNKTNNTATIKSTAPWSIHLFDKPNYTGEDTVVKPYSSIISTQNFYSLNI